MNRPQTQIAQSVVQAGDAPAAQHLAQRAPGMALVLAQVAPIQKNDALVRAQLDVHAALGNPPGAVQVFEPAQGVAAGQKHGGIVREPQRLAQGSLSQMFTAIRRLLRIGARLRTQPRVSA